MSMTSDNLRRAMLQHPCVTALVQKHEYNQVHIQATERGHCTQGPRLDAK